MLSKDVLIEIGFTFEVDSGDPEQWTWRCGDTTSTVEFLKEDFAVLDAAHHAAAHLELHCCANCGKVHTEAMLKDIVDLALRVDAGDTVPSGECQSCGAFCHPMVRTGIKDSPWDQFQQVVIASYNNGDHLAQDPADVRNVGDTLLTFLLLELSEKEDCDSVSTAIDRLNSAISQLEKVRDAFQEKAAG
ncbi:hypothetical protein [Duganella vulcania]|uniref:Uncharacterized protein n=1 Tax=Duganella vulcania TaxID=2692166 RepID=A0A845GDL3_9BURK|nr:hypothetical protein [Duganella vulcania]MYM92364.1 hypothetical protein [Duganella vulcania]